MMRIRLRCSGLSDPISSDPWFAKDHNNININYCKPTFTISLDFKLSCFYFPQSQKLECQTKLKHLVNNIGG